MNYQTVYEKKLRTALCLLLWCSPYLSLALLGCDWLYTVIPLFYDAFIWFFIAGTLASWSLMIVIAVCSRRKNCFSHLRIKRLLKQYTPIPATIINYGKIPHSTARPGKWIEWIPVVDVNGTEMIGNSFVDSAPEAGTKCEVILYQNKCWIVCVHSPADA